MLNKEQQTNLPPIVADKISSPFFTADVFSCKEFDLDAAYNEFRNLFKPKFLERALHYRLRVDEELIEVEDY